MGTGILFDLERFSTVDGPGIRTTAFFKGCIMHCPWCHNAEGLRFRRQLHFDPGECIGCGECAAKCPQDAHEMHAGQHILNREKCIECFLCAGACYTGALKIVGTEYQAEELAKLLMEDALFYWESGGGVTLSGGEVLCQAEFAREVLTILRRNNIHTAIETNLSLPWEVALPVLKATDLVMADLKALDDERHRRATGLSNRPILANLARLAGMGLPLILRTPIIPGFNDEEAEIAGIAAWARRNLPTMQYYELLPYHPLGQSKYAMLGETCLPMPLTPPSREVMRSLARAASEDVPVWIAGNSFEKNA